MNVPLVDDGSPDVLVDATVADRMPATSMFRSLPEARDAAHEWRAHGELCETCVAPAA